MARREPAMLEVVWLGHASVDIRLGDSRFLTDPVLRRRVAHLRRYASTAPLDPGPVDAVLISHLHHDHLDVPSLRRLPHDTPLVVPRSTGHLVSRLTDREVLEMLAGDEAVIGGTTITAVPAIHRPGRAFRHVGGSPIGYLLERDGSTVYFPGDTDLHPAMSELPAPDVSLLPIWGWGPNLGPGHLDPARAAIAASWLRTRCVVPIHWGTYAPVRLGLGAPSWLRLPALAFMDAMGERSPETSIEFLTPSGGRMARPPASR